MVQRHNYIKSIEVKLKATSLPVDTNTHYDLLKIMEENHQEVLAKYSSNSFQFLFWISQLECMRKTKTSSIRWHHL